METHYRKLSDHLKAVYGEKVYKLSVSAGCSCPNRDGTLGYGGCIFCAEGSGHFAEDPALSVTRQLDLAVSRIRPKYQGNAFIAYFQSYTNTYGPVELLEQKFLEAAAYPGVVGIAIGTRPDCLGPEIMAMLKRVDRICPVSVELGLQTIHPETASFIRRGYELKVFDEAVKDLKKAGLEVVVHMILGLPGETHEDMLETARYIGKSGADGIKLQLLHILKGTELARLYLEKPFPVFSMEAYVETVLDILEVLPDTMIIHRLTGDGSRSELIAPLWSTDKKRVLNLINKRLEERNIKQGSAWNDQKKGRY